MDQVPQGRQKLTSLVSHISGISIDIQLLCGVRIEQVKVYSVLRVDTTLKSMLATEVRQNPYG